METETIHEYGIVYKVLGSQQLHNRLQSDPAFFKKYVSENLCTLQVGGEKQKAEPENVQDDERTWTRKSTLLLLDLLERNKLGLRNTKIKKKDVWRKIKDDMIKHGFKNMDESMVERKFRNMKATYKTIKENRKKSTSNGNIKWEFYEAMDKFFEDNKTSNNDHTILSIEAEIPTTLEPDETNIENIIDMTQSDPLQYWIMPKLEPSNVQNKTKNGSFSTTTSDSSPNRPSYSADEINLPGVLAENTQNGVYLPGTTEKQNVSPKKTQERVEEVTLLRTRQKNLRLKQLYIFRKKQLDIEKVRVNELQLLREAVDKSNAIQAERNDLLRLFLEKKT